MPSISTIERNKNVLEKHGIELTRGLHETKDSIGGVSNKVLATVNGQKVMIKGDSDTETVAERFAYKLGTALGLNVNRVEVIDFGDIFELSKYSSVHYWEDDFEVFKYFEGSVDLNWRDRQMLRMFDSIIENGDRHTGNYGLINGDKLFLIDHGLCDPWSTYIEEEDFEHFIREYYHDEYLRENFFNKFLSFTKEDFESFCRFSEGICDSEFEDLFHEIVWRMRKIQRVFEQTINELEIDEKTQEAV